ncbi:hypothetical protein GCM10029964_090410 [Kibdelosporangium lantanae]
MTALGIDTLTAPGPTARLTGPVADLTDYVDTCGLCDGQGFLCVGDGGEVCPVCHGDGLARLCPDCEGIGRTDNVSRSGDTWACDTCDGLGQVS